MQGRSAHSFRGPRSAPLGRDGAELGGAPPGLSERRARPAAPARLTAGRDGPAVRGREDRPHPDLAGKSIGYERDVVSRSVGVDRDRRRAGAARTRVRPGLRDQSPLLRRLHRTGSRLPERPALQEARSLPRAQRESEPGGSCQQTGALRNHAQRQRPQRRHAGVRTPTACCTRRRATKVTLRTCRA